MGWSTGGLKKFSLYNGRAREKSGCQNEIICVEKERGGDSRRREVVIAEE